MKKGYWLLGCIGMFMATVVPIYARAGGGSSGGGTSYTYYNSYGLSANAMTFIFICLFAFVGSIYYFVTHKHPKVSKERREIDNQQQRILQSLLKIDPFWDSEQLQEQIYKAYFIIQYAWSCKDHLTFQTYLSETLYVQWMKELEFLNLNQEQNVLESIELVSSDILAIQDFKDWEKDYFWVRIKGKMGDYHRHEVTGKARGSKMSLPFCEYWKFIRTKTGICLDEIRNVDEVQEKNLTSQSQRVIDVVCGVMHTEKGYLIGKRGTEDHENIWEFPGGKVEPKETCEQAIIREFKEELEIQISVTHKLKVYEDVRENKVLKIHAYACNYVDGTITLHAHHEIQFVQANQLQDYTFEEADQGLLEFIKKQAL